MISGPSGVGKGTLCKRVMAHLPQSRLSVSATTRAQSASEVEGRDYYFMSREDFEASLAQGRFLEHAEVFGNYYGTPKDKIDEFVAQGETVFLEIDVQGGRQAKAIYADALLLFIMPPSMDTLKERLESRNRDTQDSIQRRLREAQAEITAAKQFYEYFVVNDDLNQATDEVLQIIQNHCSSLSQA